MYGDYEAQRHWMEVTVNVALSSDDKLMAACGTNKRALVYSVGDGSQAASFLGGAPLNACVFCGGDREARLITGAFNGMVTIYNVYEEMEEHAFKHNDGEAINCLALAHDHLRSARSLCLT